jgi:hypothetical protein
MTAQKSAKTLKLTTPVRVAIGVALLVVSAGVGWFAVDLGSRWFAAAPGQAAETPAAAAAGPQEPGAPARRIKAQLFYVAEDGLSLNEIEREVPYAEQAVDQAREIVTAQLSPVGDPFVSAIPTGTALRAIFITPQGDAFVDLSPQVSGGHPGGSLGELLTVYTIVDALTTNLPAVRAVQILIGGKEADTLAGHVDIRRPLPKNTALVTRAK